MKDNQTDTILYEDDVRRIEIRGSSLIFHSKVPGKSEIVISAASARIVPLGEKIKAHLRSTGKSPDDYYGWEYPYGGLQIATPICTQEPIERGLREWREREAVKKIECERIAALPENREDREIEELLYGADRLENSPSEDNVAGPCRLRARAAALRKIWIEKYPRAAALRQAGQLRSQAAHQDSLAAGALVYDCDGSLSREDQDRRSAEFSARAAQLRAEAENLEATK